MRQKAGAIKIWPFEAPQHRTLTLFAPSPHPNPPPLAGEGTTQRCNPLPRKRGRVRVGAGGKVTRRAGPEPGEDAGGEACRGGAVFLIAAGAQYLMHGAEREAAAQQRAVD